MSQGCFFSCHFCRGMLPTVTGSECHSWDVFDSLAALNSLCFCASGGFIGPGSEMHSVNVVVKQQLVHSGMNRKTLGSFTRTAKGVLLSYSPPVLLESVGQIAMMIDVCLHSLNRFLILLSDHLRSLH